ncbi:PadR family transcriptional regulator [Enterococcus diestrammenae]|uniref:PadR family transcriptional regulator, regulatory protein PadR n=1 Tax=Enterococcus diestrammenae TaxID=1155073 RepID=A0ABV0F1X9_9ENTE|nr:PadR family transcriptional regulator [Enterococcus diestrammenae]KAF1298513.1 PadR family transcriptional regulator [Enterococcus diestrammenae]
MKETQLLKGVLEGCVLALILQGEGTIYGYELVQQLQQAGFTTIIGGTIYPLLQKLEKNGQIEGTLRKSPEGPDRKYFTITASGITSLKEFQEQWQQLALRVDHLMGGINK